MTRALQKHFARRQDQTFADRFADEKGARDLLAVTSCFAAKGVDDDDSCHDLAEKFATLLDLIENEVDDAMMFVAAEKKVAQTDATPPMTARPHRRNP